MASCQQFYGICQQVIWHRANKTMASAQQVYGMCQQCLRHTPISSGMRRQDILSCPNKTMASANKTMASANTIMARPKDNCFCRKDTIDAFACQLTLIFIEFICIFYMV